eukprot:TRINITY_DN27800_c0_g1_i1.p1 TRINITY_DN27800_c0_g1~~TRINITY_DN27800_c0_g1_i1.p1  ORF type:complete len:314 (-),score=40.16 TRINITY_DN27800_c0_g1_i1:98-952(-)
MKGWTILFVILAVLFQANVVLSACVAVNKTVDQGSVYCEHIMFDLYSCSFNCSTGYVATMASPFDCSEQESGFPSHFCNATECDHIPLVVNGVIECPAYATSGTPCEVSCNKGHVSTVDDIRCTTNGTWVDLPVCSSDGSIIEVSPIEGVNTEEPDNGEKTLAIMFGLVLVAVVVVVVLLFRQPRHVDVIEPQLSVQSLRSNEFASPLQMKSPSVPQPEEYSSAADTQVAPLPDINITKPVVDLPDEPADPGVDADLPSDLDDAKSTPLLDDPPSEVMEAPDDI